MTIEEAKSLKVGDRIRSKTYKYLGEILEVQEMGIVWVYLQHLQDKSHKHFTEWAKVADWYNKA